MKRVLLALALVCLSALAGAQNMTTVSASGIRNGGVTPPLARVCYLGTNAQDQAINFQQGGGGVNGFKPYCATVTNGVIAGGFQVPNPANTAPAGIYYHVTIKDSNTQQVFYDEGCVSFSGATFNLDNHTPVGCRGGTFAPPSGSSLNGPFTVNGNLTVTGIVTASNIPSSFYYQTLQNAGAGLTQRPIFNVIGPLKAVDNAGATRTDISYSPSVNTVTFSATPTFDCSLGALQKIILTGNVTSSTLSNCAAGSSVAFEICEDGTGGRTFVPPGGLSGWTSIPTTAGVCSSQQYTFDTLNNGYPDLMPGLTGDVTSASGSTATTLPNIVAGATNPKITYNAKGQVTGGAALASGDIPNNGADTTGKSAKTDALNSATTVVNVSAATAPTLNQVLTATDSTHATWQTPGGTSHALLSATHTDTVAAAPVLGAIVAANSTPAWASVAGNITTTKKYLNQTGNGSVSATPQWSAIAAADVPVMVASGASHAVGVVPDPGVSAGSTKFLREDASWAVPSSSSTPTDVQVFTSNGTWTKPAGAKATFVIMIGGGGGGGSGRRGLTSTNRFGGSGGGGGAASRMVWSSAILGATETVTVGAAGTGGAAQTVDSTDGNDGVNGGDSSFGNWLRATGGVKGLKGAAASAPVGGAGGSTGTMGAGGAGGTTSSGSGATTGGTGNFGVFSPGTGDATFVAANAGWGAGGGGGSAALSSSNVQSGAAAGGQGALPHNTTIAGGTSGGTTVAGGNGGAAATNEAVGGGGGGGGSANGAANDAGGNGGLYGGGGGGGGPALNGANSGKGGDGAAGIVIVITTF